MTSLYRRILKKAWQITKKYKVLWPLGIFAAFLGNGGEYQILFKQIDDIRNQTSTLAVWQENLNTLLPKVSLETNDILPLILIWTFGLLVIGLFLWLAISSLGGIIKGSAGAEKNEAYTFRQLLKIGSQKFWPVLSLNIIAKAIVYAVLFLVLAPLMIATFATGNTTANLLIVLLTFIIFIPLTIVVSLIVKYASAEVILQNHKFKQSFKNGFKLFRENWLVSLEMALVIFVINLVIGLLFVLAAFIIFSPFFFIGVVYTISNPDLFTTLMYISITLLLLLSMIVGAGLAVFQISSWALLYLDLTGDKKVYSKIVRWAARLPRRKISSQE